MSSFAEGPVESADRLTDRVSLGVITRLVNRDLIDEVLNATGRTERRSRLLPARVVVYYVLALTLFFGDAYEEVMRKLVNGLRFLHSWRSDWQVPTSSAISQARTRLGEEPLKELFTRVAVPMAKRATRGAWYRGMRLMAIDGVILDATDTPENVAEFAKKPHRNGESVFPQVRIVGLAECGTHAIVAASLDSWRTYERELAADLVEYFEPDMLIIADRGFYGYDLWAMAQATGAALLWRVRKDLRLPVLDVFPDGSYRSEILPKQMKTDLNRGKRRRVPDSARVPVRVIEYTIPNRSGGEVFRLITTIVDPEAAPAQDLATLYEQRWEFEIGLDEIETHQIGANPVLRSKKPELVKQEIWGLLITHYAIRDLMREAADDIELDPDRLSFIRSLRVVRRSITNGDDFPPEPE
jgi:Insertion element 4 transposase N-terminal/Transposase DDE domain